MIQNGKFLTNGPLFLQTLQFNGACSIYQSAFCKVMPFDVLLLDASRIIQICNSNALNIVAFNMAESDSQGIGHSIQALKGRPS